tara:strand:- start:936 stop:1172 length:237 start_codon:yes stop_codon:yes gene_type:complete
LPGAISLIGTAALAQDFSIVIDAETSVQDSVESKSQNEDSPSMEAIVVTARQSFFLLSNQIMYAIERLYCVYNDLNDV